MATVRCKDGVAKPGPVELGGAGGDMCCQTDEHNAWSNALTPEQCAPVAAVYDECDPGPEPPGCGGPTNNVGSCIGDPVDVTTGNLEQMATDLDLGRGLAFTRHYASDEGSTTASPLGPHWRSSLDWRLVYDAPDPTVETALVWRPLGGSDLFLRFTSPITQTASPWTGGTHAQGGVTGGPASGFVYTHRDGTRVYFDGQTRQLEKIEPPGEAPIVAQATGSLTTFRQGEACLAVTRAAGRVESVASRPAATCDTGPNDQLWTYAYDAAGCLHTVTANGYPGVDPPQGQTQGVVSWSYTYEQGSCARLERVERAVNSVISQVSQWTYDVAGRVTSIDEPALDQKLSLAYPETAPAVTEVRDASGAVLLATVTASANRTRIESVSGLGGPGFAVPFKDATFTEGPGLAGAPEGLWRTTTDLNDVKTLYEEHDTRGRPRFVTEGWRDLNGNGVIDGTETYERRREHTYHPRLDAPLTITQRSVLSPAGNRVETSVYDPSTDRLLKRRLEGFTLDANGAVIPFLDETTYGYDQGARLTSISGPRPAQHTEIDYDPASGSRSALRRYLNGPGSGYLSWSFSSFDSHGNPRNVTDPNGRTTAFTYDGMGRVLTATPPYEGSGSTTLRFTYDVDGNLIRVDFPLDSAGNPVFLAFGYDAAKPRLLRFLADSQGNAIVYTYENGRVQREQRFAGFTSLASPGARVGDAAFSFTSAGHLFRAFNPLFAGGTVYSELGSDPKGNPTSIRDENGKQDILLYDALDRLTRISQARAVTYETDFTYDSLSNVTSVTDAAAKATALLHDDRGNLVESVSPDTGTTRFVYDAAGNLVQKIEDATPTGAKRTTSYGYDGLGRLGTIDLPTDPDWVFSYDTDAAKNQKGRLAEVSNGEVTTQLEYTRRGDVAAERTIVDGLSYAVQYLYDPAGNREWIVLPSAVGVETRYAGLRPGTLGLYTSAGMSQVTDIAWYPFGPRQQAKLPPLVGGVNTVTSTRGVNLRGQVTDVVVTSGGAPILDRHYTYDFTAGAPGPSDPGPNLDRVVDALDATESRFYFYDALDRLQQATSLAGTVLHQYGYDAAGNRTSKLGPLGSSGYGYQPGTDRLEVATGAEARAYAHDVYGNRIYDGAAAYAGTPSLRYDESNRMVEVRDPANGFATLATYRYDAFGRRVKKTTPDKTLLFFYDTQGHLVEEITKVAGASNDLVRSYVFLEDELVGLVDDTVEVGTAAWLTPLGMPRDLELPLVVLGLSLVAGLGAAAATRRWPVAVATASSGLAIVLLCAGTPRPPPRIRWVHTDPLGAPLAMTDSPAAGAAVAVWRARYEPFGKATVDEDPDGDGATTALNVRLPGQYADAETGWHYNFYRTYDPVTGRYLEADPIGLGQAEMALSPSPNPLARGINANLYLYAGGNPTNAIDPSGLYYCVYSIALHTMTCVPNDPTNQETYSDSTFLSGTNYRNPDCGDCRDNVDRVDVPDTGPLPPGFYRIGRPRADKPTPWRRLTPDPRYRYNSFNRSGFGIHFCPNPRICSEGCIATPDVAALERLNQLLSLEEGDNQLTVLP